MYLITHLVAEGNNYAGGDSERLLLTDDLGDAEGLRVVQAQSIDVGPIVLADQIAAAVKVRKENNERRSRERDIRLHEAEIARLRATA